MSAYKLFKKAVTLNKRILDKKKKKTFGRRHPFTLRSMNNLALMLESQGKYEEAERINRQALALWETVLGKDYPDTLTSMNNLALVLKRQGKYDEAISLIKKYY